jgi:FKBP-type peptidyl-prolyl cis-trans isomerase SlyD
MQIEKNSVVEFTFSLVDDDDQLMGATQPQTTAILFGSGNVIAGIEEALAGRSANDQFTVTVPPEQGYGMRRDDFTQRVSKKYFADPRRLKQGQVTRLQTEHGSRPVTIVKVGSKMVDVDLNHPHAGQTLRFNIHIHSVRKATREELSHGHAHGSHGAH